MYGYRSPQDKLNLARGGTSSSYPLSVNERVEIPSRVDVDIKYQGVQKGLVLILKLFNVNLDLELNLNQMSLVRGLLLNLIDDFKPGRLIKNLELLEFWKVLKG